MNLTLDEVKQHCKIDHADEDVYLKFLIDVSIDWLKGATGFDLKQSNSVKAKIACLAFIYELHKDRSLTTKEAGQRVRNVMNDILIQLAYESNA